MPSASKQFRDVMDSLKPVVLDQRKYSRPELSCTSNGVTAAEDIFCTQDSLRLVVPIIRTRVVFDPGQMCGWEARDAMYFKARQPGT
ncbi:hypothetical protein AXG93_4697s1410 [Marchantia polymorpha subsp. ruderalis]|uniref:Uncharacterized protein n=1 Tax=Marchantia polymorpha subsp. ruderalis TaxID=1480154 RepID=A0A176VNM3_MARPO|nr:hypothetical protein AXG93_4697s1410 [Marchantia polymorpha subsp. ruderalis]